MRVQRGDIEIDITNGHVVDALTAGLSQIDRDRAIRSGLAKGGTVLASGGRRRLRSRMKSGSDGVTGNLLRSFVVRVKRNKPGVLVGFRQGKGGGSHAHLVSKGTLERSTHEGWYRGAAFGNRFWEDTRSEDTGKAKERIREGLEAFVEQVKATAV